MKRKIIKRVLIALPILILVKCSGVVDDFLGEQFPLNVNNNGNSIKIHVNEIKDSTVKVTARYLSGRCTIAHLNAAYTKVSYSSDDENVEIDNVENSNGIMIFTVPISGGGWCNWRLINIYITPMPVGYTSGESSSLVVDVSNTDVNNISYEVILAPITLSYKTDPEEKYYIFSKKEKKSISGSRSGNIYFTAGVKNELSTHSLFDEGIVIFPNGTRFYYGGSGQLTSPEFSKILENSILKDTIPKWEYKQY